MMKVAPLLVALAVSSLGMGLVACGGAKKPQPAMTPSEPETDAGAEADAEPEPEPTTFDKVGKREGLEKALSSFLANASADPRAKALFAKWKGDKIDQLKLSLLDHVCKGIGGDCTPEEPETAPAKVTDKQFDALVEDLKAALSENEIGEAEQTEIVNAFTGMRETFAKLLTPPKK